MLSNFLRYGINKYSKSPMEISSYTILSNNDISIIIENMDDEYFNDEYLYLGQSVVILENTYQVKNFRIKQLSNNQLIVKPLTEFDIIKTSTNIMSLHFNEHKIYSSTYNKDVSIDDIELFGSYIKQGKLYTKIRVLVSKPKFASIYKYSIKYKFLSEEVFKVEYSERLITDYKNNDILEFETEYNGDPNLLIKVSGFYLYKNLLDESFYSTIRHIDLTGVKQE